MMIVVKIWNCLFIVSHGFGDAVILSYVSKVVDLSTGCRALGQQHFKDGSHLHA